MLIIAHAGLPEYWEFAELAANNPHVYLDTTMVGTSYMEQVAPIPPGYVDTVAGLSHKVVFGTDFPSIPYSYRPDTGTRKLGTRKPMGEECPLAYAQGTPAA
ncbi:amidohydrolase family protein [Pseudarthrobacter enclensis]|uniref:TIM-barrel fold metal-dependent hydrolase n=1 Tax=Pseudarthrobacter enclensis TaxID=993070 RepID=A0ABT9RYA1_9MICC|nr:putative TIM-barrel fold metal-dependent hydrolase [Pseudarthrobacter enclensis]